MHLYASRLFVHFFTPPKPPVSAEKLDTGIFKSIAAALTQLYKSGERKASDAYDATFVWYEMLVDKYASKRRCKPVFKPQTFYSQLKHIYIVRFSELCQGQHLESRQTLVAIYNCKLTTDDPQLASLNIHLYMQMDTLDISDVTNIQTLIGRVKSQVAGEL
ncbi:hypothetical protein M413DRAFT_32100 [Hebeloma cylindrosporum]|uniref:Uncharacterized protein n=1 Tax=Hebeloma cylindrosporum TaxID=76867 RepID=A0A0C3BWU5_HEBCY|nr:hypothetical protein M413DRAFT_32100 [Hebeloma cylindrosporum h7]